MTDKVTFTRYDQSAERASTSFHIPDMTAANFDAITTSLDTLDSALDGLSLADRERQTKSAIIVNINATRAGNRELKWLIRVRDVVTAEYFAYELACADESPGVINVGGKTILDPASAEYSALAAALTDPNVVTKNGNNMNLVEVELVGRNL